MPGGKEREWGSKNPGASQARMGYLPCPTDGFLLMLKAEGRKPSVEQHGVPAVVDYFGQW